MLKLLSHLRGWIKHFSAGGGTIKYGTRVKLILSWPISSIPPHSGGMKSSPRSRLLTGRQHHTGEWNRKKHEKIFNLFMTLNFWLWPRNWKNIFPSPPLRLSHFVFSSSFTLPHAFWLLAQMFHSLLEATPQLESLRKGGLKALTCKIVARGRKVDVDDGSWRQLHLAS